MSPRPSVLLLRAPDRPGPDRYVAALSQLGFDAICVPVLRFEFVRLGDLQQRLAVPMHYQALVLTSPRAVEALRLAGGADAWATVPTFTVGPRTARMARELGLQPVGEDAGAAEALAAQILTSSTGSDDRPLLLVCGERRREALPTRLRKAGLALDELAVYRSRTVQPDVAPAEFDWIVWFSPSGVEVVFEASEEASGAWNSPRRAAIGPTTADALAAIGCPADVVAARPTPEALADALRTSPSSDSTD